jgi:hypothetical protein
MLTERMLFSSSLDYPKSSHIANLIEYGTSSFSGYRNTRAVQGIPLHIRRLDRLVAAPPGNQRAFNAIWDRMQG